MNKILSFGFILILTSTFAYSQVSQSAVDLHVSSNAQWSIIKGEPVTYYELYITSHSTDTIHFLRLNVIDKENTSSLYTIHAGDWRQKANHLGNFPSTEVLPSGGSEVLFLEYTLPHTPLSILHELSIEIKGKKELISGAVLTINAHHPLVLGVPLKGGPWGFRLSA